MLSVFVEVSGYIYVFVILSGNCVNLVTVKARYMHSVSSINLTVSSIV